MRTAETVLSIIHERAVRGLPLEDVYRVLYNPALYLSAYGRISQNAGALTPGATAETADGMSLEKIGNIIALVRREAYRWTPVRRIQIPKKSGKMRPLGIPTWSDKLMQEVIRLVLETHYEPRFSRTSHGFRPGRGCHTALHDVTHWHGTKWFIEGDIKGCFDNIDHEILLSIMAETIHDNRFIRMIRYMLQAGYLEDWVCNATLSGTPQGGIVSPILANIYLDRLDQFVERELMPAYNRGKERQRNPSYRALERRIGRARKRGDRGEVRRLELARRQYPYGDPNDPNFRRLRYVRYADDFLLGFIGPKVEAETIKVQLREFLRDTLKLELSQEKTLVTHATTDAARFLGYELTTREPNDYITFGKRSTNGTIGLRVPADVIEGYRSEYVVKGEPLVHPMRLNDSDFEIVARYGVILRGIYNYYCLASDASRLGSVRYYMARSLLHTLARKHRTTVTRVAKGLRAQVDTPRGPRRCFEKVALRPGRDPLVARFGGFSMRRQRGARLRDARPYLGPLITRNERARNLTHEECQLCGESGPVEGHHIRKLADLARQKGRDPKPWEALMAARRRKSLFICQRCHNAIHAGRRDTGERLGKVTVEPDASKDARPVRRGGRRKRTNAPCEKTKTPRGMLTPPREKTKTP